MLPPSSVYNIQYIFTNQHENPGFTVEIYVRPLKPLGRDPKRKTPGPKNQTGLTRWSELTGPEPLN
jgi:hypothetical protein